MTPLAGRDIVCVGFADWDTELWTNQQHLMSRLAQGGSRVLFVESLGLRRPTLAGRDIRRIARRVRRGVAPPRRALDSLPVLSPLVLPLHSVGAVRAVNARLLPWLVRRGAQRAGLGDGPVLWSYVPQAEALLDALDPSLVVYHCVDDISAHERIDTASFLAAEERFARRADLVIASAPSLAERMRALNRETELMPNVADVALFATALQDGPVDAALDALPHPRIVFTGAVSGAKVDLGLLEQLAALRPGWSIALVGPVGLGDPLTDVSALERASNVHLLGPRRYEDLPAVLRGADAALIPYAVNPLTAAVFPMKVYEYLAAGLPVVASPLPSIAGVEGIETADGADAFAAALDAALAADSPDARRARNALADGHSWEARLAEIEAAVARAEA